MAHTHIEIVEPTVMDRKRVFPEQTFAIGEQVSEGTARRVVNMGKARYLTPDDLAAKAKDKKAQV